MKPLLVQLYLLTIKGMNCAFKKQMVIFNFCPLVPLKKYLEIGEYDV